MRNKILFLVTLLVAFTLGVLSVRAWQHWRVTERVKAEYSQYQHNQAVERQQKAEASREAAEEAEKIRLHDVCVANAVKAKTAVANCNIKQVQ